uniref:Uncharacterized protein AlNc14C33G2989 n=1 Tax=Albugo laibachii Nc14 TaxID=890382 RepID=F0W895_9STRA|nr:conserved unknown protein putative [Albugo laibachii Nc14]|eukprot:CCA17295.1 conserved unknown protein putative [Albugo laibachii Nc14]
MQTVTIALPGSIIDNAQTKELKTYLAGQIARAAVIFQVDEIVIYDDHLGQKTKNASQASETLQRDAYDCHVFLMRILQYLETPQYLRKQLFPKHTDLSCAGLLNPLDTPHHVRSSESSLYREGVVSDRMLKDKEGSYVYVGLPKEVRVDKRIHPGIRVTVKLDQTTNNSKKLLGTLVSPSEPRQKTGIYWGYTCRFAPSLRHVWQECPYESGYDLKIGTSERGNQSTNDPAFSLPAFKHGLIVFGGVAGIEECVGNDETISLSSEESNKLFDMWVNTCPSQGSRTIRTEEAVLISLSALMPHVSMSTGSLVNSS